MILFFCNTNTKISIWLKERCANIVGGRIRGIRGIRGITGTIEQKHTLSKIIKIEMAKH